MRLACLLMACALPAHALELGQCERTTHISHGGEADHRDLGHGRVAYAEWWSQEGVFRDLIVADCKAGERLMLRTQEDRIGRRPPFDRRAKAASILARELQVSPSLFSLDRLAGALKGAGRDISVDEMIEEPCACAALYPEYRGDRAAFAGID